MYTNNTKRSEFGNICHHKLHFIAGFEAASLMCPGYSYNITPFLVKEWLERFYLLSFNVANVDTCITAIIPKLLGMV